MEGCQHGSPLVPLGVDERNKSSVAVPMSPPGTGIG